MVNVPLTIRLSGYFINQFCLVMKDSSYVLTIVAQESNIYCKHNYLHSYALSITYWYCDQIWPIFQELMHCQIESIWLYIETKHFISFVHTTKHNALKSDLSAVLT